MGKLFGTDGIRGIVGENLTVELAFHVGQAVAAVLTEEKGSKPTITIGKDTRISSDMLEAALMAGICSVGGDVMPLGTIPTPAVAYLTVLEQADAGIIQLDAEQMSMLSDAQTQMRSAKAQLQGSDYSRMLLYLTLPVSVDETYAFIDTVRTLAQSYYPDGNVYVAGDSTNEYDFQKSFAIDNIVVSVVSVLIVLIVLLFTFQSVAMPILLILVIEGAIWVNFSVPAFIHTPLYFMGYLIVSSIQMGANIDYAIVIATRYNELRDKMDHKTAMIETLNFAFPTILTSGTIMTVAGTLIGQMTSDACIVGIGQCLGRGTIISIFLVLFVLPQILLVGGKLVDKTSFSMHHVVLHTNTASGRVRVNGMVQGEVNGSVAGTMNAVVDGNVHLTVLSGKISQEVQDENDSHADE